MQAFRKQNQPTCLFSSIENDIMSYFIDCLSKNDLKSSDGTAFENIILNY